VAPARHLRVTVGSTSATFAVLDEDAPKTADALWESLPITGKVTHARWAGAAVFTKTANAPVAGVTDVELPVTSIYPGTLVVRPGREVAELFLAYGTSESRGPTGRSYATPVAEVVGAATEFFTTLGDTWTGGSADVTIERVDG
jgi:hypothetical protein